MSGPAVLRRYAFVLRLRRGAEAAYDAAHRAVWPEMLALLKDAGISEYSIFRRGQLLVLTLRCVDFEASWSRIENDPVNRRWQAAMAPFFADAGTRRFGKRFEMLDEVFYVA